MFAHHREVVARVVEVEDALIIIIFGADRCVNLNIEMHIET